MQGGYGYGGGAPPGGGWPPQGPPGAPPGGPPGYGAPPGYQAPGGYGAPAAPAASFGPPVAAGGQYEFNATENEVIEKLASRLTIAGVMEIIFGACQLFFGWAFGLGGWLVGLPGAIAMVAIGALFVSAASSFRSVTQTRGHDVSHLMGALGKLSTAAIVQIVGYIIAVALGIIIGLLVLFVFAALLVR